MKRKAPGPSANEAPAAKPRRGRTLRRKAARWAAVFAGSVLVILLLVGVFLILGGAKTVIELALPAVMNGYVTLDEASYFYFASLNAKNLSMVLDWQGEQETVLSARKIKLRPRLLPLLSGRLEFAAVSVEGADLNLRILPSGLANIDRLFRLEPMPPEPTIRVFPPYYTDIRDLRLRFPPFTYGPVQIDRLTAAFLPLSHERAQVVGFGTLTGPLLGTGSVAMYLDIDDEEYVVAYEGGYIDLDLETMQRLPVSPDLGLQRMVLPEGRVRLSALVAGRGRSVDRVDIRAELAELDVHWLQYPLSVTGVTGRVTANGQTIAVDDLLCLVPLGGTNATLRANGLIRQDGSMAFDAALANIRLADGTLAFLPGISEIRDLVSVNGEATLTANVYTRQGWAMPRVWADFAFRGQVLAVDYPVPAYDVQARIRTVPRGGVIIDELSFELGDGAFRSVISANGSFDPVRDTAQFSFCSPGISVNNDLLERLPQVPRFVSNDLRIEGLVSVIGEYVHASEDDALQARAELTDFEVRLVRHDELGARGLNAEVELARNRLAINNLAAEVLSGALACSLDVNLTPDDRSFRGSLTLTDLDLSQLPPDYVEDIAGILNGQFHFEGTQPTARALILEAELSLREGRLMQLPVLISIINFLNLQLPGEVVFRSGYARLGMRRETVVIERVELYSDTLNVYAKGRVGFDGSIDLRAGVGYRKPFLKGIPLIGPIITFFTGTLRSALTTVDVTGHVSDPKIRLVSVSYLTSPISAVVRFFAEEEGAEKEK